MELFISNDIAETIYAIDYSFFILQNYSNTVYLLNICFSDYLPVENCCVTFNLKSDIVELCGKKK